MGISYFEKERIFKLDTKNSSYVMGVVDKENFLGHVYFGKRIESADVAYLMRIYEPPFVPSTNDRDRLSFLDAFPMEFPTHGLGDFRNDAISVKTKGGHTALSLSVKSHEIYKGKKGIAGLPATFGSEDECESLEITLADELVGIEVVLTYSVFEDCDAVTRSVKVRNCGKDSFFLTKVMTLSFDMDNEDYDILTLHGSWARERHINRRRLAPGYQGVSSLRGETSHQEHSFLALMSHGADEDSGDVYGFSFIYSGNFVAGVNVNQFDNLRTLVGINPEDFTWKLSEGEEFLAPEGVMVYSGEGIGNMTRSFHDLFRNHLIRGEYKDRKRPILINNWEATYFDFNTEKLIGIAKEASKLGIEMLVMDDGWFGHRNDDNSSLGDWFVNESKLQGGLSHLVFEVNKLGMKFGIWFEPEMISPDSKLYEAHPDWAIAIPGRRAGLCRNQYVLDLSRDEVVDYTFGQLSKILESANIEYVKWDMNRQLADLGSISLPSDRQGELFHRYVLGVYRLQEMLITKFPHLLLENCSGGGARYDAGMLYYSPQIWCSDDTDAVERLEIQEGTSLVFPLSSMGAHVSDCPNHTVGRVTPFETRGYVALAGTFGYELDVTRIPENDRNLIPGQIKMYHKYNDLVRLGDYYRIASYSKNHEFDAYMTVSKDKSEALFTFVQVLNRPNQHSRKVKFKGLNPSSSYRLTYVDDKFDSSKGEIQDRVVKGDVLMNCGLLIANPWGDFTGKLIYLQEV